MSKIEGPSGPSVQQSSNSIRATDERMAEILSGPGTEKEKVAKLEKEIKSLVEAKPKYNQDKLDQKAEIEQIANQIMNQPNSQLGKLFNSKLSADSRNRLLDKLVGPKERIMTQVGNFVDKKMKEIKADGFMQQRMGRLQEKLIQQSFLEGTPRAYQQKIDTLKKEIDWAKEEIANYTPRPSGGWNDTNTISLGGITVPAGSLPFPSGAPDGYLDKVKKMLGEKEMELEFVENQYRQKFPVDNPLILKQ